MPVPVDLIELSDVVKNHVVKKTEYDKLVGKVNNIDTSKFVLKTKIDTDKSELENKIPDTSGLLKKTNYDAKSNKIKDKIPDVSNLATKTALTTVENKTPSVSSLIEKTHYNTKVTEIENKLNNHNRDKYIATPVFHTLAADVFNPRLSQVHLVTKTNFDNTVSSLDSKIAKNNTKNNSIRNELKKLKTFYLGCFIGKSYFEEEDGEKNYVVFQPIRRYFRIIASTKYISSWKYKGYLTKLLHLMLPLIIVLLH